MNTKIPAFLRQRLPEPAMTDITKYEGRPQAPAEQPRREPTPLRMADVRPHHPEVVNFMNRFRDTEIERDGLAEENARLIAEIHAARQTIIDNSQTIREITAQRDRYMRTAAELEVRIGEIGSACHRAVLAANEAKLQAEETIRTNEESPEERDRRLTEHLGATFGAGREPGDGGEQPT